MLTSLADEQMGEVLAQVKRTVEKYVPAIPPPDRQDVVGDVMERVLQKRDTYDPLRGTVEIWLWLLVREAGRRYWDDWHRRHTVPLTPEHGNVPDERIGGHDMAIEIGKALTHLTYGERYAFVSMEIEGHSLKATARALYASPRAVQRYVQNARNKVRRALL